MLSCNLSPRLLLTYVPHELAHSKKKTSAEKKLAIWEFAIRRMSLIRSPVEGVMTSPIAG